VKDNLFAYTAASGSYPGYVSVNRLENGDVEVSVRSAPRERQGVYVCSHQPGPGNCTAGGPSFVVPAAEWRRLAGDA
jgi:hypothetical protein